MFDINGKTSIKNKYHLWLRVLEPQLSNCSTEESVLCVIISMAIMKMSKESRVSELCVLRFLRLSSCCLNPPAFRVSSTQWNLFQANNTKLHNQDYDDRSFWLLEILAPATTYSRKIFPCIHATGCFFTQNSLLCKGLRNPQTEWKRQGS